jgi:aminoglycoside 3-N-acetyltransferase
MTSEDLQSDLTHLLNILGLSEGETCYVAGNISALARTRLKKDILLPVCLSAFKEVIGPSGTIFSPSASMNLCNTNIPYDIENTPSNEMGAFAEYIRTTTGAIRSFHPFWSISGLGKKAEILLDVSRHSYGVGSPWSKFLDLDARQVNIGLHPSKAVTLIHHIEVVTGVPYRYTKEFLHPILQSNGRIINEPFYMSVMYENSDIQKRIKLNEHYFQEMEKKGLLHQASHSSGLNVWSFKMRDFYNLAINFFLDDIYNYLENPPLIRPFNQ